jgi:signal transduction histidine kinase
LTIEDAGPGLPDTLLTDSTGSTFRRFNELRNTSVEGQGMGLAIIKDVAVQLGAEVTFSKSETLGGLRIELRFKNLSGKNNSVK